MAELTEPGVRVERDSDQRSAPQHADLEEDLDALVDPETQRIMDEADLLDFVSSPLTARSSARGPFTGT